MDRGLADAVVYARQHGAREIYVVAWSMGAGIALELLRRDPAAFDRLALVAPATNWRGIIRHGVERTRLPAFVAPAMTWALACGAARHWLGLPEPLDFERLDWSHMDLGALPTLVIHSEGDEEIPFELTKNFAIAHPGVALEVTRAAPHGWEANLDPEAFQAALTSWLAPGYRAAH